MKKILSSLALFFLGFGLLSTSTIALATDSTTSDSSSSITSDSSTSTSDDSPDTDAPTEDDQTYSPSITITLNKTHNGETTPAEGVKFTITPVTIDKSVSDPDVDLTNSKTYSITDRGTAMDFTTDADGKITVSGAVKLPKGLYEIQQDGKDPFVISLPYKDSDGMIKDDWEITPKPDVTNDPKTTPQTPSGPIMQTSGSTSNSFVLTTIIGLVALLLSSMIIVLGYKKIATK